MVREMPSVELHRTVCAIGRADTAEILALATPEQMREILDLDLWEGDQVRLPEALDWLQFICSLPAETHARNLGALDPELLGLVLLRRTHIYLAEEENVPDEPEGIFHQTPDGWFILDVLAESESEVHQILDLVGSLYRTDPSEARHFLQTLMGELPSNLEETSYRWRNARLADLGFANPEEALVVYAYLDPRSVRPEEGTADQLLRTDPESPGHLDLAPILPEDTASFWHRATALVTDAREKERLAGTLLALANRTLSADRVAPSDLEGGTASLEGLLWRLSLGLEHLCDGVLDRAPRVLASVALMRVCRLGHSLVLDLRRRVAPAVRAGRLGSGPGQVDRLDPPLADQMAALYLPRPLFYDAETGSRRPFHGRRDLEAATGWIASSLAAAEIVAGLGLGGPLPAHLTLGDLYRTAVINRVLGREGPLDAEALQRFVREQVRTGSLARLLEVLADRAQPEQRPWLARWLAELEENLRHMDPERLDLRFVGGLWLKT
jgi:hypothetical protein